MKNLRIRLAVLLRSTLCLLTDARWTGVLVEHLLLTVDYVQRKLFRPVKGDFMKTSGPESVRRRLNRFAIATIVAGVVLLALARPVTAKIVYKSSSIKIGFCQVCVSSSYNLDLNDDGVTDFTISVSYKH